MDKQAATHIQSPNAFTPINARPNGSLANQDTSGDDNQAFASRAQSAAGKNVNEADKGKEQGGASLATGAREVGESQDKK